MTARLTAAIGLLALIALMAWLGIRAIGQEVWSAAWTLPILITLHLGQLYLSGVAWRGLCGARHPALARWWRIRWIRESVNSMLPVAQLGGNLVGVRLLAANGLSQAQAAAGTVLDLAVESPSQAVFTLTALATLCAVLPDRHWWPYVAGSAALITAGVIGFMVVLRLGLLRLIEAAARRFGRLLPGLDLAGLQTAFAARLRDRHAIARAAALHLFSLFAGILETWLGLAAMGMRPGLAEAFVIESLGLAVRGAAFAVPAGLGAQEAGYVLVGALFGLPATDCVALSMLKRAREVAVGTAGLLSWHRLEFTPQATVPRTMR